MGDYTYNDMIKMQEDAAKRVREMKKRSAIIDDEELTAKQGEPTEIKLPDSVKHISYPVEISVPEEREPELPEKHEKQTGAGILDMLTSDGDALLILAILFVISGDSSDYPLALSLLYLLL